MASVKKNLHMTIKIFHLFTSATVIRERSKIHIHHTHIHYTHMCTHIYMHTHNTHKHIIHKLTHITHMHVCDTNMPIWSMHHLNGSRLKGLLKFKFKSHKSPNSLTQHHAAFIRTQLGVPLPLWIEWLGMPEIPS